jgi:hypothetical protein
METRTLCPIGLTCAPLLTIGTEIIVEYGHRAVRVDSKVQGFVHKEVVSWTLADNPEVVYERLVGLAILKILLEALLRNASRLVLGTSGFAGTADALWLKMEEATDIVAIDGERDQGVQGARKVHSLSSPACCARDKNGQINLRCIIFLDRRISWDYHARQQRADAPHHFGYGEFHGYLL